MKKLSSIVVLSCVLSTFSPASVTINFGLGTMYSGTNTSSAAFPSGGVINLLAATNSTWSALATANGFASIGEMFAKQTNSWAPTGSVLVGQIANDDSSGPGITGGAYTFDYVGGFNAGDELLTVAYVPLTLASTSPGLGTDAFWFRSATAIDGSDIGWVAPSDGGTYAMGAYTVGDAGGSLLVGQFTSGNGAVSGQGFTTVPEPSTYALLSLAGLALGGYAMRRRRRA